MASDDAPGASGREMTYKKVTVTVTVTDVDEDGSISLSAQQPQVGVALTATLTDQDARSTPLRHPIINGAKWKWEQGPGDEWALDLISGAGAECHADANVEASDVQSGCGTPSASTSGRRSPTPTSMAMTRPPWRSRPHGPGKARRHKRISHVPWLPVTTTNREVDENSPPGTAVGQAGHGRRRWRHPDLHSAVAAMTTGFAIDRATGQITVGPRAVEFRGGPNATATEQHV